MQVYSNELYHYGVVGMKWGVRRYQNPDGSLKPNAKRRYTVKEAKQQYKDGTITRKEYKQAKVNAAETRRKEDESAFKSKHPNYKGDNYYGYKGNKKGYISNTDRLSRTRNDAGTYTQRGVRAALKILGGAAVYAGTTVGSNALIDNGKAGAAYILSIAGGTLSGALIGTGAAGAINAYSDYKQSKK